MSLYRDRHEKDEQEANIKENAKTTEIEDRTAILTAIKNDATDELEKRLRPQLDNVKKHLEILGLENKIARLSMNT